MLGLRPLLGVFRSKAVEVNRRQRALRGFPRVERFGDLREGPITHGQHAVNVRKTRLDRTRPLVVAGHTVPLPPRIGRDVFW